MGRFILASAPRDMKRKLTTIFCADVSGYSRMMGADEARTLTTLKEYREAIEGFIARHHGRVVSWSGDGLLAEFASVVEAVQCAAEVQRELQARNSGREEDQRMTFRIGINLGDVMADGDDIFGEGVNIAARLQQMAVPGGILVSSPVYDQVRGKLSMGFSPLGSQTVKNIAGEVQVYAVTMEGVATQKSVGAQTPSWGDSSLREPAAAPAPKRGKLFRRGLALIIDYGIVATACVIGALALNTLVDAASVRMDLDLPFVDYGDVVDKTGWRVIDTEVENNAVLIQERRNITYDYLGLFRQTYEQERTRGRVSEERDVKVKRMDDGSAPPEPVMPPAPGELPAPPEPPEPPPPPEPSALSLPRVGVDQTSNSVTITMGGHSFTAGPEGFASREAAAAEDIARQAAEEARAAAEESRKVLEGETGGVTISITHDDEKGWTLEGSHTGEYLIDPDTGNRISRPSLDTLSLVLLVLYFAVMEAGRRGATIGKNAFDLTVTTEDGKPITFGKALGRNLIKVLSAFIFPIAILIALFSKRRQGIHDRIARTVVVQT
jgi:class 3 adenylate cyclase